MKIIGWWMGYFNWFHSIRGHRYLNEKRFCPIGSSFPAILGFWGNFWRFLKIFHKHFCSICDFYCTQNDRLDLTVSTQKSVWKWPSLGWVIWEKPLLAGGLVWHAMSKNIFVNISAQGGSFFKPIFALKPWDQDGRFEYNKRNKLSKKRAVVKWILRVTLMPVLASHWLAQF